LDRFKASLERCELHDLGFIGDVFTWRNKQLKGRTHVRERLDRAVANGEWREKFPMVLVRNGDMYRSDHRPVIILTERSPEGRSGGGENGFKFEASWLKEEGCRRVVEDAWGSVDSGDSLSSNIKGVARSLKEWSSNSLGDLEKRLKEAKRELERWRRAPINDYAVGREAVWSFKVDRLEDQIDMYWRQRAHINWLQFGDRNTSYFHNACSERKRRNRIGNLKKDDGGWVVNEKEKMEFITNHFVQLFRAGVDGIEEHSQQVLSAVRAQVTDEMNSKLMAEFTEEEVKNALDSIGDLKAPGPDRLPSVFYKKL
jgi:hypothetical protein